MNEVTVVRESARRFLARLAAVAHTAHIHDVSNKAMDFGLKLCVSTANRLLDEAGPFEVQGVSNNVHVNGIPVRVDRTSAQAVSTLFDDLHEVGLGGLAVSGTTSAADWRRLLNAMGSLSPTDDAADQSAEANAALQLPHLRFLPPRVLRRTGIGEGAVHGATGEAVALYGRALAGVEGLFQGDRRATAGIVRTVQELVELAVHERRVAQGLVALAPEAPYIIRHPVNTAILALLLGNHLGLGKGALLDLGLCALACDAGMTRVPREILDKSSALTPAEIERIRRHPLDSASLALEARRLDLATRRRLLVTMEHHLGMGSGGYPGVMGWGDLHLFSRIIAVTDTYDALVADKAYRKGLSPDQAMDRLLGEAGTNMDPALVLAFSDLVGRWPVGTVLLLSTGEVAVAWEPPLLRILADPSGKPVEGRRLADLGELDGRGQPRRAVIRALDPASVGVSPGLAILA